MNCVDLSLHYRGQAYFTLYPSLLSRQPDLCANGFSQHCPNCRDHHCIIAGGFSIEEMHSNEFARETMWRPYQARFYNMGQLKIKRKDLNEESIWASSTLVEWMSLLVYTERDWTRRYNQRGDEQ